MLLSAPPLLQTPAREGAANDGHRLRRGAARALARRRRRGPGPSRRSGCRRTSSATILSRPPRAKIAPPPPPSYVAPVALPCGERQVLHDEARRGLVITVRRGPDLPPVAGVLIQDAALPAAAEGDQTAAVEDDAAARVDHLGGPSHLDPHRVRPAAEPDDPALCHGPHDRARCAAARRAGPDPTVRARRVDGPRLSRHRRRHRRALDQRRRGDRKRHGERAGKGQT